MERTWRETLQRFIQWGKHRLTDSRWMTTSQHIQLTLNQNWLVELWKPFWRS